MNAANAYLVKGFLLAQSAPKPIMDAIEALIGTLPTESVACKPESLVSEPVGRPTVEPMNAPPPEDLEPPAPETKKKREWSPEAKAAAAERMRKAREAKSARKTDEVAAMDTRNAKAIDHSSYIGKREDGRLMNSDWPDIRNMLNLLTRQAIAEKYGVTVEDLNAFIATKQVSDKLTPDDSVRLKPITEPKWDFKNENLGAVD